MFDFIKNRSSRWFLILTLMMCFFPWNERASSIGMIVLGLHTLIDVNWRTKWKQFSWNSLCTLALVYWVWHVVGMAWTSNIDDATQSIQVKLSFVVFPMLFGLENHWNERRRYYLTIAFVSSLLVAFFYLLLHAQLAGGHLPLSARWQRMWFAEPLMNPGYISNYYTVGLLLLVTEKRCWSSRKTAVFSGLAVLLLLWAILIFIAKIAVLFILLMTGVLLLQRLWHKITNRGLFVGVAISSMALLVYAVTLLPPVARRLNETEQQLAVVNRADINYANSTMSRKVAYGIELRLVKEAGWFGFGTGSTNQHVLEALDAEGYVQLVSAKMHAHNQFMNTGISLGWIGLLVLILFSATALVLVYQKNGLYDTGIVVLMIMSMAIEDLFEIQACIVFYIVWVFMLGTRRNVV